MVFDLSALRDFGTFVRQPRLTAPTGLRAPDAWTRWRTMTALYLAVLLLVLAPAMAQWQRAFALPAPEAFGAVPPLLLLPLVALVAPVVEELAFRGWLTGRPAALWLAGCALAGAVLLALLARHVAETEASLGFVVVVIAAAAGAFALRTYSAPPHWFRSGFPAAFAFTTAVFALSHLANYPRFSWALLPMVLPQLWAGLVLGFVRMRIGLVASMLAHALANAVAAGLALALSQALG